MSLGCVSPAATGSLEATRDDCVVFAAGFEPPVRSRAAHRAASKAVDEIRPDRLTATCGMRAPSHSAQLACSKAPFLSIGWALTEEQSFPEQSPFPRTK